MFDVVLYFHTRGRARLGREAEPDQIHCVEKDAQHMFPADADGAAPQDPSSM